MERMAAQPGGPPTPPPEPDAVDAGRPRVDPDVLRPVVRAGYQFADRLVVGRIEAAIRRLGGDDGLAREFAREAAVEPEALEAIADYGSQCLAQIFEVMGLGGEYACWVGFALFVGADVKRKDNVLRRVGELARMQADAEKDGNAAGA